MNHIFDRRELVAKNGVKDADVVVISRQNLISIVSEVNRVDWSQKVFENAPDGHVLEEFLVEVLDSVVLFVGVVHFCEFWNGGGDL